MRRSQFYGARLALNFNNRDVPRLFSSPTIRIVRCPRNVWNAKNLLHFCMRRQLLGNRARTFEWRGKFRPVAPLSMAWFDPIRVCPLAEPRLPVLAGNCRIMAFESSLISKRSGSGKASVKPVVRQCGRQQRLLAELKDFCQSPSMEGLFRG